MLIKKTTTTNILLHVFESPCLPNNMLISTLVGPRFHAGCRQESHLLTANYPQLVSKFILILEIKKWWLSLGQKCANKKTQTFTVLQTTRVIFDIWICYSIISKQNLHSPNFTFPFALKELNNTCSRLYFSIRK